MKSSKTEELLLLLLSVSLFSLAFPIILGVFSIPNRNWVTVTISLLSLISLFIKKYAIKMPLYLLVLSFSFYIPYKGSGYPSFILINKILYSEFTLFTTGKLNDYPLFLPHFFILLFLLVLIELQFTAKKTTFVGIVLISYLLLLDVYNDIDIVSSLIGMIPLILIIKMIVAQGIPKIKDLFFPVFFMLLLGLVIWLLPTEKIQSSLLEKTATYRTKLTKIGVYADIDRRKYGVVSRTGFGENDSELGGALAEDSRVQFKVKQKNPHYWRVDSKEIYTGKGWEVADLAKEVPSFFEDEIPIENGSVNGSKDESINVSFTNPVNYVPTTYGEMEIVSLGTQKRFAKNIVTNRVDLEDNGQKNQLQIKLFPPNYSDEELKQVPLRTPISEIDYLQLPDNYSKKVAELASEITQNQNSLFEQVKSVETYLKQTSKLTYSKKDTSYPGENQDYVEHFLFESQVGYCDNFSTSMVVMLRTLEIPARWVKGFNTGVVTSKVGGVDVYSIRNQDAHSWVEVYFDGYGWLPFEPTPTFVQPAVEKNEISTQSSGEATTTPTESAVKENETKETVEKKDGNIEKRIAKEKKAIEWGKFLPYILATLITLLIIILLLVYRYRLYLQAVFLLQDEKKGFMAVYPKVLEKIESKVARDENMPLVEFAALFEMQYSDYKPYFSELTQLYENELYGNIQEFSEKDKNKMLSLILIIIKNN